MIGLVRAAVLGFLALSVVYVLVSIYSRSVRRERLEKSWDSDPAREGQGPKGMPISRRGWPSTSMGCDAG